MLVNDILLYGGRLSNILQLINSKTPTVDIYSQNETWGGKTLTCVLQIKMISVQRSPEDCKINIFSLTLCSGF